MEVAAHDPGDCVVTAMVGAAGLLPTIAAIEQGRRIALANKETMASNIKPLQDYDVESTNKCNLILRVKPFSPVSGPFQTRMTSVTLSYPMTPKQVSTILSPFLQFAPLPLLSPPLYPQIALATRASKVARRS